MADENQELRKVGLKVTLPRIKILQMLDTQSKARDCFVVHHASLVASSKPPPRNDTPFLLFLMATILFYLLTSLTLAFALLVVPLTLIAFFGV